MNIENIYKIKKHIPMGLFSTLTSAITSSDGQANLRKSPQSSSASSSSSANIPTLVQLYAGDVNNSNNGAILMENTPLVTGYTTLTYQAVQVGEQQAAVELMVKNHQHTNPDLGVWNCRVQKQQKQSIPLIDSLLAKVAPQTSVYCLTVDLSDETSVETNLSSLQAALVRHLIEHPPTTKDTTTTETDGEMDIDPATDSSSSSSNVKIIKTTSLYDLQTVQFGLASEEKATEQTIEETAKDVKIGLMICAVVGSSSSREGDDDTNQNNLAADLSSESAYKKKQARALVVYHLRKFANAINAALCFVERPAAVAENQQSSERENKTTQTTEAAAAADDTTTTNASEDTQIAISYDKLSQLWRDMAMGIPVWEQQSTETEDTAAATALYGPGRQQEDLIESLLLRNANYPGHWDASKDSLWVALPAATSGGGGGTSEMSTQTTPSTTGDGGWLTQLRDSIASALPTTDKTSGNEKASADNDGKPKEKDKAVSSFFESLLANP
ncbi:MAG: hypothetical protein ACI8RD_000895 [Bacillariaceae sp.]